MGATDPAKAELAQLIKEAIGKAYPEIALDEKELLYSISYSLDAEWDISSSIAMRIARQVKKTPAEVAEAAAKGMRSGRLIVSATSLGGYINAKLDEKELVRQVIGDVVEMGGRYGSSDTGRGKKVLIEYPSVNPNKPWHLGHLRNPLLGDSISRIMAFCSYKVERMDYIDDLGLQMAEMLWGSRHLDWNPNGKKYDQFLGEKYVEINRHIKEPGVEDEIKSLLKIIEDPKERDSVESATVREIAENCVRAQYATAFAYGICHDGMVWESDILHERLLDNALALLKEKGIARVPESGKYAGCLVVSKGAVENGEDDSKVLVRSNGAATYLAKDIAFHMWKLGIMKADFKFSKFIKQPDGTCVLSTGAAGEPAGFGRADIAVNTIGSAQKAQQEILKNVLSEVSGRSSVLHHLSYGEVGLAEGSLSGRKGTWLGESRNYTADDLLRETKAKALDMMKASREPAGGVDPEEVSGRVALAAIKFDFLRVDPARKLVFDWDRALDFNANSGPYCMYMYARATRILEKGAADPKRIMPGGFAQMGRGDELALVKLISQCRDVVEKACKEYRPNVIADYVMELSFMFGKFYQSTDVLKSGEAMPLRLAIVWAARQAIYNMLCLLGIETVERM
ncbi:MAG: arginine--tRNA ligase [Candidatus Marsarchaeota archaeon]|nr:arginine--tRNA ligase [Candidatus Marsarchaeota archaeon]